jgi:hypothetical protein
MEENLHDFDERKCIRAKRFLPSLSPINFFNIWHYEASNETLKKKRWNKS